MRNALPALFGGAKPLIIGVIGVGSAHGDDQIAWYLIDQLAARGVADNIHLEKVLAPAVSLIHSLQCYERVILIDAADMGLGAGECTVICDGAKVLSSQLQGAECHFSSHHMGVAEMWQLAQQLELSMPQINLFAVQIEHTETLSPISHTLRDRLPQLGVELDALLGSLQAGLAHQR